MSQPLHPRQGLPRAVDNQYLFSDHTLANLLPRDPRWRAALSAARDFHAWLQDLYEQEEDQLPNYNEAQLEAHWIRPILQRLGHTFEPQATVPGLDAHITRPDYVLFPDPEARQAAAAAQNTSAYGQHALAVAEAKSWDRSLDKKEKGGGYSFEKQNPGYQIDTYVRALDLPWGLLTNGRRWRLVHGDTSHRLSI